MYKIWLKGIFEGISSSKSIFEGILEGIFTGEYNEGIFSRKKYNEGIVEGRLNTCMDCIMSRDFGQTITQLLN